MLFTAESAVTAGSKKWIQKMEINLKDIENYYNHDDWRLFNPNDFNTITTLNVKDFHNPDNDHLDQVDLYVQKIKNRSF